MSNNIYNILSNFNKVAQEPVKPATQTQLKNKTQLQESMDQVLSEKYMGFKKTVAAVKKGGADNPEAVAASIGRKKYGKEKFQKAAAAGKKLGETSSLQSMADKDIERDLPAGDGEGGYVKDIDVDESALQAYLGNKKYGKEGMDALRKAGRDGASKEKMAKIRAKHDKMDEAAKPDYIDLDKDGNKDEPMKKAAKDAKSKKVQEVAPPGAKAERMVKHIKKGYAKDGKVTDTEKAKAYGAAWKAHNKGKLEETIRSMIEAGFTKEQIIEGWDDMLKAVANRSHDMKTGEKRQGAKGEIEKTATGVKHTRRYDKKTGETDTDGDGQQVKRGRGRPKKSQFESRSMAKNMIVETFTKLFDDARGTTAPIQPKDAASFMKSSDPNIFNKLSGTKPTAPTGGTIKQGTWQADAPKAGEKPVPVPQNPEVAKEDDMEEGNAFGGAVAKAKADGVQPGETIKVGGKTYPVKEGEELLQMLRIAGIKVLEDTQLDECGMSSMGNGMMGQHEQEGRMNVSTNMSSDGTKSVTITADGDSAAELMQMLKLAGMGNGEMSQEQPKGVMVVSNDDEEEVEENLKVVPNPSTATSVDQAKKLGSMMPAPPGEKDPIATKEAKDEHYHANTTPDEHVMPVQVQTKGGDGDVAGREKKMTPNGYQFGDNPHAMKESMSLKLIKEYENIKVKK
jgi:hypothetical protein